MTIPAAFTTTILAWSMLSFPKAYVAASSVQRSMNQLSWGADYLAKTVTTGSSAQITYQVWPTPNSEMSGIIIPDISPLGCYLSGEDCRHRLRRPTRCIQCSACALKSAAPCAHKHGLLACESGCPHPFRYVQHSQWRFCFLPLVRLHTYLLFDSILP